MSETIEKQPAYISRVHLKGYKSIRDLEIDFKAGLNIIIGPNGSGKTNFLEGLYKSRRHYFTDESMSSVIDIIENSEDQVVYSWISEKANEKGVRLIYTDSETRNGELAISRKWKVFDDKDRFEPPFEQEGDIRKSSGLWDVPQMLGFGIPEPFDKATINPARILFDIRDDKIDLLSSEHLENTSYVINNIFLQNQNLIYNTNCNEFTIDKIDITELNRNLNLYSPIGKIQFDKKRVLQYIDETNNTFVIDNLLFQFFINGKWLYWNQLSDGTKRLFFLISIVTYFKNYTFIEEPELGIHPDQLYLLMDFLKEQSKEKQIIITTHSPEVLSILGKDELDRIIVTRYDAEKGTQMHHLSPKKIRKGVSYMSKEGLTLKDFWVHSNLEAYDEEEFEIR